MHSGRLRRVSAALIGSAVLLGLAAPAVSAWRSDRAQASAARVCAEIANESAVRNAIIERTGARRITVLGDSYSAGYGLANQSDSWPTLIAEPLQATVTVRSLGGTGYVAAPCGPDSFPDRAPTVVDTDPDLVIVQGGLNDVLASPAAIRAGAERLLSRLNGADVVLVGPPAAPKWLPEAERVDHTLSEFAAARGVRYVSTYDWPLEFADDGIHLAAGLHRIFAERVAEAVR